MERTRFVFSTEINHLDLTIWDLQPESNGEDLIDDVFENGGAAAVAEVDDNNEINRRRSVEKGPFMYELYAILIHSGNASGGHYYAYIKDFITGQWFCFNDQNVTGVSYH